MNHDYKINFPHFKMDFLELIFFYYNKQNLLKKIQTKLIFEKKKTFSQLINGPSMAPSTVENSNFTNTD